MLIFFKAQASSLIATAVDFITTIVFVELFFQHYVTANIAGALMGALTNFGINRQWVFGAKKQKVQKQSMRYTFVWFGSLFLSTSGIYILTHFLGLKYFISKMITSLVVGITFNYWLQKKYVFSNK
ncbi:GtrA family protein [Aurantibacillus circumpalustris]|uniref:GtrA family protein n=1 Tax=Aurantibacillus circumpalustris TaxID=3036359 RepID=UPI00295B841C|nr:GtrA family protein [Aurantibacillus circumpalustris]